MSICRSLLGHGCPSPLFPCAPSHRTAQVVPLTFDVLEADWDELSSRFNDLVRRLPMPKKQCEFPNWEDCTGGSKQDDWAREEVSSCRIGDSQTNCEDVIQHRSDEKRKNGGYNLSATDVKYWGASSELLACAPKCCFGEIRELRRFFTRTIKDGFDTWIFFPKRASRYLQQRVWHCSLETWFCTR